MPKCKNDIERYCKGTEPSPKGYSVYSRGEKMNKKKIGKDRHIWKVRKDILKNKRWLRCSYSTIKCRKKRRSSRTKRRSRGSKSGSKSKK
jgi:hypothetical protein